MRLTLVENPYVLIVETKGERSRARERERERERERDFRGRKRGPRELGHHRDIAAAIPSFSLRRARIFQELPRPLARRAVNRRFYCGSYRGGALRSCNSPRFTDGERNSEASSARREILLSFVSTRAKIVTNSRNTLSSIYESRYDRSNIEMLVQIQ